MHPCVSPRDTCWIQMQSELLSARSCTKPGGCQLVWRLKVDVTFPILAELYTERTLTDAAGTTMHTCKSFIPALNNWRRPKTTLSSNVLGSKLSRYTRDLGPNMTSSARAADRNAARFFGTQDEDLRAVDMTVAVGGPGVSSSVPQ